MAFFNSSPFHAGLEKAPHNTQRHFICQLPVEFFHSQGRIFSFSVKYGGSLFQERPDGLPVIFTCQAGLLRLSFDL